MCSINIIVFVIIGSLAVSMLYGKVNIAVLHRASLVFNKPYTMGKAKLSKLRVLDIEVLAQGFLAFEFDLASVSTLPLTIESVYRLIRGTEIYSAVLKRWFRMNLEKARHTFIE